MVNVDIGKRPLQPMHVLLALQIRIGRRLGTKEAIEYRKSNCCDQVVDAIDHPPPAVANCP